LHPNLAKSLFATMMALQRSAVQSCKTAGYDLDALALPCDEHDDGKSGMLPLLAVQHDFVLASRLSETIVDRRRKLSQTSTPVEQPPGTRSRG